MMAHLNCCNKEETNPVYINNSGVSIRVSESGIFITNGTNETIHYFVIEKNEAALIRWIPVCNPNNEIEISSTKEISYSNIPGYFNKCEVLFYWWNCEQINSGEMKPDNLKSISFKTE